MSSAKLRPFRLDFNVLIRGLVQVKLAIYMFEELLSHIVALIRGPRYLLWKLEKYRLTVDLKSDNIIKIKERKDKTCTFSRDKIQTVAPCLDKNIPVQTVRDLLKK